MLEARLFIKKYHYYTKQIQSRTMQIINYLKTAIITKDKRFHLERFKD